MSLPPYKKRRVDQPVRMDEARGGSLAPSEVDLKDATIERSEPESVCAVDCDRERDDWILVNG